MNKLDQLCVITDEISQDFEHALNVALKHGVKVVDLRKIWGKNIASFSNEELRKLKDILQEKAIKVKVITGPFGKCFLPGAKLSNVKKKSFMRNYKYNLSTFDRLVEISDFFETDYLRIFTFLKMGISSKEKAWNKMKELLEPYVKRSENLGKILVVENDLGMNVDTIDQTKKFFKEFNSSCLKLILDPGNYFMARDRTDPAAYDYFFEHDLVGHYHVKDPKRKLPFLGALFTVVGEGKINYERLFQQAIDYGYRGCFSLETHSLTRKELKSSKSLENMAEWLKKLK